MSILVISLPPRPRLRSRSAEPLAVEASGADEFDYLLSSDGFSIQAQGRCAPSLLPKADSVVAVLPAGAIAWHRPVAPRAPAARLRAGSDENTPATSSISRSSSAAMRCTGPMKAPGPPPIMAMRSRHFGITHRELIIE